MKVTQSILVVGSGLFVGFTINLFILFIGYAQGLEDKLQDLLIRIGWSGMVFIFLSIVFVGSCQLIVFVYLQIKKRLNTIYLPHTDTIDHDRRSFIMQTAPSGMVFLAGGIAGNGIINWNQLPQAKEVSVSITGLPKDLEGFRIVHLTDIHVDAYTSADWIKEIVNIANSLKPDIIAVTGDLVDGPVDKLYATVEPLTKLSAPYGSYFVTGNHEYGFAARGVGPWIKHLHHLGFDVLLNEHRVVSCGQGTLLVGGVTDYNAGLSITEHTSRPSMAIKNAPITDVKILLAHQPKSIYRANKAGFDLQLSGHTHGGQIFPGQILMGMVQPFVSGLHRYVQMQVYVSSGAGCWGPKIRVGSTADIAAIVLTAA